MIVDPADPARFDRWLTHRLGVAMRFLDVFTGRPVRVPLAVTVPAEGWRAVAREDATYRFVFTEREVPAGLFDVEVEAPGGEYVSHVPVRLALPVVPATPPPPAVRGDYLVEPPLWPTRRLRVPAGETAVVALLESGGVNPVEGLEVRLFRDGEPVPAEPFARSDLEGELLFRLPWVRRELAGSMVLPPPTLRIEVRVPSGPVLPAVPSTFVPEPGREQTLRIAVP